MDKILVSPKETVVYEKLNPLKDIPTNYSVQGFIISNAIYPVHLIKSMGDNNKYIYYSEEEGEIPEEKILGWVYYPEYIPEYTLK